MSHARKPMLVLDRRLADYVPVHLTRDVLPDLDRTYLVLFDDGSWGYRTLRELRADPVEVAP